MGCGPRGITDLLAARVGAAAVWSDSTPMRRSSTYAREHESATIEFVQGNAYATGLPGGTFDLVHTRFVGSTAGEPEALLREAMRLARPGGVVAMEEPDMATLICNPPSPAWDALRAALIGAFAAVGSDINLGRRLYALARHAGLADVQYRPFLVGVRSGDPITDYLPSTVESLRGTIRRSRIDVGRRSRHRARRLPRAPAQSGRVVHTLRGGPGLGTDAGHCMTFATASTAEGGEA